MASMAIPRKMTPTHPMANFSLNNGIMSDWSLYNQQNIFLRQTKKHNLSIKNSQILNLPAIQNPGVEEQDDTSLLCLSTCLKLFWEILSSNTFDDFLTTKPCMYMSVPEPGWQNTSPIFLMGRVETLIFIFTVFMIDANDYTLKWSSWWSWLAGWWIYKVTYDTVILWKWIDTQ